MNRATRRAFDQVASTLNAAFLQAGPFPDQEITPPLLADEVSKCLEICQQLNETDDPMPADEINELGTHMQECLSDLGLWAYQLELEDARTSIEDIALQMTHCITQHGGRTVVLEPVVNALTRKANATHDPAVLAALFERACAVIAGAAEPEDATDAIAQQSWLALHFNSVIIAARTRKPGLLNAACDLLESHLPQHCAAFYEEGLRESAKPVYGEPVRAIMRERHAKWTPQP